MRTIALYSFAFLLLLQTKAFAADGVDNSYVDNGANELDIFVNNSTKGIIFGPGVHSAFGGSYYIVINNGAGAYGFGTVTELTFTFCSSRMLSAYLDRISSARFYYRIYLQSQQGNPPGYTAVNLQPIQTVDPATCFTVRQPNTWQTPFSVNVLNGLSAGAYYVDFYTEASLDDVGDESMGCPVNAPAQCSIPEPHTGRVLRSRFNTTDPNACNYTTIFNTQSAATRISFSYGVFPLSWTAFSAERLANDVKLQWKTELEWHVDHFEVERSTDAARWEVIDMVKAYNDGLNVHTYSLIDAFAPPEQLFYRLSAVDFDLKHQFSPSVAVSGDAQSALAFQPNPANRTTNLVVHKESHLLVFGTNGQLVLDRPGAIGFVSLETYDWDAGFYSVLLMDDSGTVLEKQVLVIAH